MLGRVELEGQLFAILDLTAEEHAERRAFDQRIALRLALAAEQAERERRRPSRLSTLELRGHAREVRDGQGLAARVEIDRRRARLGRRAVSRSTPHTFSQALRSFLRRF